MLRTPAPFIGALGIGRQAMQDSSILLLTHAQLSIAVAGFSSVAAAIRRPLTPLLRQRFLALLSVSFQQVFACMLPVWLSGFIVTQDQIWQTCSIVTLLLYCAHTLWLVVLPMRKLGRPIGQVINPFVTAATWLASIAAITIIAINAIGYPGGSTFHMYYAGNAIWLFIGFMIFADVATTESDRFEPDA